MLDNFGPAPESQEPMRKLKSLVVASFAISLFMLCSATGALAGPVTSLDSSYTQNPFALGTVTVNASMTQAAPETSIEVKLFIVLAWDSTCSTAGYPGGPINDTYAIVAGTSFSSQPSANFTVNATDLQASVAMCAGAIATHDNSTYTVTADFLKFGPPTVEVGADSAGENVLNVAFDVDPVGVETSYWLSYFKKVATANCNSPDADDLATAQTASGGSITSSLGSIQTIPGSVTGLDIETEYCISANASNSLGSAATLYWLFQTTGAVPVIDEVAYTVNATEIHYAFDVNPGTLLYDIEFSFQYFEKTRATCPANQAVFSTWYHVFTNTPRGFSEIHETGKIDGLTAGSTYCIRPLAINEWAPSVPATYQSVTTTAPADATISDPQIATPTTPGPDAELTLTIGDGGAQAGINTISNYDVSVHQVTADRCNATEYFGGASVLSDSDWFVNSENLTYGLNGLTLGQGYCVAVLLDSAWGSQFDVAVFKSFEFGNAPAVTDLVFDPAVTSFEINANVNPGYLVTTYGINYRLKPAATACSALTSGWTNSEQTLAVGSSTDQPVTRTATGLTPNTDYCAYLYVDNSWGSYESAKTLVHTDADTLAPSVPTGLAQSLGSMTSLQWNASSDNVAVTDYLIYKNGTLLKAVFATSNGVQIACSEIAAFTVAARDAAGNVSAQSAQLNLTGEACPDGAEPQKTKPSIKQIGSRFGYKREYVLALNSGGLAGKLTFKLRFKGKTIKLPPKRFNAGVKRMNFGFTASIKKTFSRASSSERKTIQLTVTPSNDLGSGPAVKFKIK